MSNLSGGVFPSESPSVAAPQGLRAGMATAALVFGLIGVFLCPISALVALILGIIATSRACSQPNVYGGKGMAIAGICLGGIGILWMPLMISILLPSLSRARELAKRAVDASNLTGVGQACLIYAHDHGNQLPPDFKVLLDAGLITQDQLQNLSDPDATNACDYYFVRYPAVAGSPDALPSDWIFAFADPAYHNDEGANILFLDGHVEFVKEPEFTETVEGFRRDYQAKFGSEAEILDPY